MHFVGQKLKILNFLVYFVVKPYLPKIGDKTNLGQLLQ